MSKIIQPSLASGIWGRNLDGRVDLERYPASARELENMYVTKYGGVSNRPGMEYAATAYDNIETPTQTGPIADWPILYPFKFGEGQNYVLSFHDEIMRVYREGGLVLRNLRTSGFSWTLSGSGTAEYYCTADTPVSEFGGRDIPGAQLVYNGSSLRPEGTIGSLGPGEWAYGDNDTLGFNTLYMRLPGDTDPDSSPDGWIQADFQMWTGLERSIIETINHTQSYDVMYINSDVLQPRKIIRLADDEWVWELSSFTPETNSPGQYQSDTATKTSTGFVAPYRDVKYGISAIGPNGDESFIAELDTTEVGTIWPDGDNVRIFWNSITSPTITWTASGAGTDEYYATSGGGSIYKPTALWEDSSGATYGLPVQMATGIAGSLSAGQWDYADNDTLGFGTVYVRLTGGINPGTQPTTYLCASIASESGYNVFKDDKGYWAWIGTVSRPFLQDDNIIGDAGFTPREKGQSFKEPLNYPRANAIFQQRLMYAGTDLSPQTVFGSTLGNIDDFSVRYPLSDDDSIEATLDSSSLQIVKHMVPQRKLLVFTDQALHAFDHGNNSDAITPTNLEFRIQDYIGCSSTVRPIPIDNDVVYVGSDNKRVYATRYKIDGDAYVSNELTLHIPDQFETRSIVDIAYQRTPESLLWLVMDDGTLMTMTYLPEQQVVAWANHSTDGLVKNISVIREGDNRDYLYLSIIRDDEVQVERMDNREFTQLDQCKFLDNAVEVDLGENITDIRFVSNEAEVQTSAAVITGNYVKFRDITRYAWIATDDPEYSDLNNTWFQIGTAAGGYFKLLKYDGTPVTDSDIAISGPNIEGGLGVARPGVQVISGLHYAQDYTVSVLADGDVYDDLTITPAGTLTLPESETGFATVQIGLPYTAYMQTNRLTMNTRDGSTLQDKEKNISKIWLRTKDTRGCKAGPAPIAGIQERLLRSVPERGAQRWFYTSGQSEVDRELTMDTKWDTGGMVAVRQDQPLPLTLLAIIMEIELER